jgi:hypothetical protein
MNRHSYPLLCQELSKMTLQQQQDEAPDVASAVASQEQQCGMSMHDQPL